MTSHHGMERPSSSDGAPWLKRARAEWLGAVAWPHFNLLSLVIGAAWSPQGVAGARTALVYEELGHGRIINIFGRVVPAPALYMLLTQREDDARVAASSDWPMDERHRFSDARAKLVP